MTIAPEQEEIRELARGFAHRRLRPLAREDDERIPPELFRELGDAGFLGMLAPEEAFGLDLDLTSYLLALEELAREDASVAVAVGAHNGPVTCAVRRHGTSEQRGTWLPRLASGEAVGAFALAEPEAGSDVASIRTTAERDGSGWRLSGKKSWVANGGLAGLAVVFARAPSAGVSAFLVDTSQEGYVVTRREATLGLRGLEVVGVDLLDLRLGPEALLGELGEGIALALGAIDVGRIGIAAVALGIGCAARSLAGEYAAEREQFGRKLADFGATRAKFAEMAVRLRAARLLMLDAARTLEAKRIGKGAGGRGAGSGPVVTKVAASVAMAKLAASETATWVADEAVQVFGGYGYMRHYPVERRLRDARGTELLGGTSEILRHVIAREGWRTRSDRPPTRTTTR